MVLLLVSWEGSGEEKMSVENTKSTSFYTANTFERWCETAEIDLMSFSDCQSFSDCISPRNRFLIKL